VPTFFFNESSPKFAAQAIRKAAEIGWKPVQFLASISNSVGSVLKPAGLENAKGILSTNYLKDPTDPTWKEDPAIKEWAAFMDKYFPEGDKTSTFSVYGYLTAQTMVQVLKQCGDELTRENVMRQAANLKDFEPGLLLPGIKINTSPTDYFPVEQMQMSRFNGEHNELFGSVIAGEIGTQCLDTEARRGPFQVQTRTSSFGDCTSASAECGHWSGRAVRWSSCAILLRFAFSAVSPI
jgi:branched-chain amino acid transport system substrate-binding protein